MVIEKVQKWKESGMIFPGGYISPVKSLNHEGLSLSSSSWNDLFSLYSWHLEHYVLPRLFTLSECYDDNNTINNNKVTNTDVVSYYL